ncbi:uncharacterized protein LOC126690232 [Quercus robur]|uniref:uncharacterized protein LOC126690232 n=1 Tax=Quercus robur TaxID=38942 RepID=UPI002162ABCE|nr:uncharacterized protein LOC126690232 [Quercus robur]
MSYFKLPLGLCGDIESLIRKFWWDQKGDRRKVHWVKWDTLCKPKSEGGMGFKDLANFNDALLAKQAWQLLHQKNSLFYRVFKVRFFPNCSILEASYSSSGSYAWHSILKGRDLLLKGAWWRLGCGDAISVWNNAWLPSKTHPRIESQVVNGFEEMKVSALIDPITKKWDSNMLNGLFTPQEAELILSIPLCPNAVEDTVVWPFTPSGIYTVRSGTRQTRVFSSIQEVLMYTDKEKKNPELLALVMWTIWHRRNRVRTSLKEFPLAQVAPTSIQALEVFQQANSNDATHFRDPPYSQVQWSPPAEGEIKVNFDGAQFRDMGKAGLGVVIRNSRGQALASLSEQASLPFSPDITEALVATGTISFTQGLGFTSFILEGDSANIIKTLKSKEASLSSFGHILSSAKSMMADGNIRFSHVGRMGNMVAHNLAQHARHVRGFSVWTENVPPHLSHVLCADYG